MVSKLATAGCTYAVAQYEERGGGGGGEAGEGGGMGGGGGPNPANSVPKEGGGYWQNVPLMSGDSGQQHLVAVAEFEEKIGARVYATHVLDVINDHQEIEVVGVEHRIA